MCQCSVCGEYFSTVSNFDKHRKGKHGEKVCEDPESVGLVIGSRGQSTYWRMPSQLENEIDNQPSENGRAGDYDI